jgi:DNA invertase Pin-like site-specific DNA recombinase
MNTGSGVPKRVALYARVSLGDHRQTVETQLFALREHAKRAGWEVREFTDTITGSTTRRPGLDDLRRWVKMRTLDGVAVTRIDRLGRSLLGIIELIQEFDHYGAPLIVTEQGLDMTTPAGRLQMHLIGAFAEYERSMIRERTLEGLARARAQGRRGGRPRASVPENDLRYAAGQGWSLTKTATYLKLSRATVKKRALELGLDLKGLGGTGKTAI